MVTQTKARTTTKANADEIQSLRERLDTLQAGAATRQEGTAAVTPPRSNRRRTRMTATSTADAPLAPGHNDTRSPFQVLHDDAEQLGADAGKGKDTQIKFALKLLEAAHTGVINNERHKHGHGVDDAQALTEVYVRAQAKHTVFDAQAPNHRKTTSNARKMIKLGMRDDLGHGQPQQIVNSLINKWRQARKDPEKAKLLNDANNTLMKFATAQLKSEVLIPTIDLEQYLFKPVPDATDIVDVLSSIRAKAQALIKGEIPNCPEFDDSPEIKEVVRLCAERIEKIGLERQAGQQTP